MREKRSYVRLNIPMEIVCSFQENKEDNIYAIGQDISLGGVRILIDRKLGVGAILELNMTMPFFFAEPIIVFAEVVWQQAKTRETSAHYETGLRFIKINIQNKKKIKGVLISAVREILKKLDRAVIDEKQE
ncbi:MAG: PilZ domain-containing protein [Elusimicrobia bacterium]|nr:PilZ domain-containing protein [Elusimicrobiota bacterium]